MTIDFFYKKLFQQLKFDGLFNLSVIKMLGMWLI